MHFLFLMNLPSVSNSNSPFKNQSFPTDFLHHIIYYPVFPCISTEKIMTAKIAEVINLITISDSKISMREQSTLSV